MTMTCLDQEVTLSDALNVKRLKERTHVALNESSPMTELRGVTCHI